MSDTILTSRKKMEADARLKIADGKMGNVPLVKMSKPRLSGKYAGMTNEQRFDVINKLTPEDNVGYMTSAHIKNGGSGFDISMEWGDGSKGTVREKINSGFFMSSNTLPVDWENLWDATRIDVTVRKTALPTVRQLFYRVTNNPAATRTINPTEIDNFGVVFEENNGHGQAVPQGETLGGGYESFTILIYAAGFTWDLMARLFDRTITPERIVDAVMVGYNALRDDIAISPILNFSYSGVQQTPANTLSGAGRQELLYLTLEDALDDLGDREHPVTGRKLDVSDVIILAHPYDARHIARVARGLPNTNEEKYPGLSEISQVVAYDGETINLRAKTVTYAGATKGTAYMAIPASALPAAGYMEIVVKEDLMIEVDEQPDAKTLTQEQRAYWFAEGIWYDGIQYFIQEITVPAW